MQVVDANGNVYGDDNLEINDVNGKPKTTGGGGATWGAITGTLSAQTDLQNSLNAKQDTLVSATNIKTVNSTSLLGSGNIAITASAAWGGITGTLSSQTDLQTALDTKPTNKLAVGTNVTGTTGSTGSTGSTIYIRQVSSIIESSTKINSVMVLSIRFLRGTSQKA